MPSNIPLEVLQNLNWEEPIEPHDPRFVDTNLARGEDVPNILIRKFGYDQKKNKLFAVASKHVLLFGPIGCGKSTELLRLHATLSKTNVLYPIRLNLRNEVDINNLQYSDVLMALATAVVQELESRAIPIPEDELAQLSNWFKEHIETQEGIKELAAEVRSEIEAKLDIPFFAKLMSRLTATLKNSSSYKTTMREVVKNTFSQFVTAFNALIIAAEKAITSRELGQRLLLIVDGTDKIPLEDARRLFVADTEQLIAIRALVIYTAPISLKYEGTTHSKLDTGIVLPIIKLEDRDKNRLDEGWRAMRQMLAGRIDLACFTDPQTIEKLIAYSGGHPRELLRLLGLACELTDDDFISESTLERAAGRLADEFRYWLSPEDYLFLAETDSSRGELDGMDPRSSNLLWRLALLQYNNGSWRASHPLVRRLPEYQKAMVAVQSKDTAKLSENS